MISLGMRIFASFFVSRFLYVSYHICHMYDHICILLGPCLVYLKILLGLFSGISDALFVCKEKAMGKVK